MPLEYYHHYHLWELDLGPAAAEGAQHIQVVFLSMRPWHVVESRAIELCSTNQEITGIF